MSPKFVYVSNTKSGSSSVYKFLEQNYTVQMRFNRPFKKIPPAFIDYPSFTVVRHPYPRLTSWWWSAVYNVKDDRYGHQRELAKMKLDTRFSHFLKLWKTKKQTRQVVVLEENKQGIDYVVKLENIDEEMSNLPFFKSENIKLTNLNHRPDRPKWEDVLSENDIKEINKIYHEDFIAFGYEKA